MRRTPVRAIAVLCARATVCALAMLALGAAATAHAATSVVSFDDLPASAPGVYPPPPGSTVSEQYRGSHGVRWDGQPADGIRPVARSVAAGIAHSGPNVVDIATCQGTSEECGEGFFTPSSRARLDTTAVAIRVFAGLLDAGQESTTAQVTLTAFDANGAVVGTPATATVTKGAPFSTELQVTAPMPNIASFTFEASSSDTSEPVGFDDLAITYPDAPPPPDISLSPGNGVVNVLQGTTVDDPLELSRINGSDGDVTFSVSGLPTGMSATFVPNPLPGKETAVTMKLTAAEGSAPSDYTSITITATPAAGAGSSPRSATKLVRITENCSSIVRFDYVDARANCLKKENQRYVAINKDVRVNGLIIKPLESGTVLAIDADARTIKSEKPQNSPFDAQPSIFGVAIDAEPDIPIYAGPINWDFSGGSGAGPREVIGFDVSGVSALNGLPITGMSAAFTQAGKAQLTPTLRLNFWPFNYFSAPSVSTQFTTDNDGGADFSGLEINVPKVEALAITLKDVNFKWREGGTWTGSAKVILRFASGVEIGAGFGIKNNDFDFARGSVGNLNTPIGAGVFLQRLGFEVTRNPIAVQGQIGFSGGPKVAGVTAVSVDGALKTVLADPWVVRVDGGVRVGERFSVGDAFVQYSSTGLFEFGGGVDWDFKIVYLKGRVDGWVEGISSFNVEGSLRGCLRVKYLPDPCAAAKAILSSIGIAGCLEVYGYGVGAGATWTGSFDAFTGCDLGPYRATHSAAGASARTRRVAVPPNLPLVAFAIDGGKDAPPAVTLRGPRGERVTVTRSRPYLRRNGFLAMLGEDGRTYVVATKPSAGIWTITSRGPGGITRVRKAHGLPKPSVRADVKPARGRSQTLSWRVRPRRGQVVRFAEVGKGVRHTITTVDRPRGSVRFKPYRGPGGRRRIVALVEQNGLPRANLRVASYRAPAPRRPGRPRNLRIARKGSDVTVRWRPNPSGFRHAVVLRLEDGSSALRIVRGKRRSVKFGDVPPGQRVRVTVTGLTKLNAKGPAARRSRGPATR